MYVYMNTASRPSHSADRTRTRAGDRGDGPWTVGFHDPNGVWRPESDHKTSAAAAKRAAWLNGSGRR
jgi:hypothetical protein